MIGNAQPYLDKPVLRLAAEEMGLKYWDGEPFRFEGAFVRENHRVVGNYRVPIIAVFEHELDIHGFEQEVIKLAHISCPLKIGITYSNYWMPTTTEQVRRECENLIWKWTSDAFRQLSPYTKENPESEYVYLMGVDEQPFELSWYHLTFNAGSWPETLRPFELLKG
jgi:hypothetical protein